MKVSDLTSPTFYANPYHLYKQLRAAGPIIKLAPKVWVTGRYSIIDAILRDRRMGRSYMHAIRSRYGNVRAQEPIFRSFERMLLLLEPPNHTRLRGLLAKAFNAKQEASFRQLTQVIADRLIDRFVKTGSMDVMRDYAVPIPLQVICTLLDVPYEDAAMFSNAVDAIVLNLEVARMRDEQIDAANTATIALENYFAPILHERRRNPGDDLISRLLLAEEGNNRLTEEEILANIILLFFAGHETTANMIGNALIALHHHPEQLAKIIADVSLVPGMIAECLRYDGSVQLGARAALEDMEIEGTPIARGDMIFAFLGAANRDPDKFEQPDQLIIERTDTRHLTFGGGIHHCLGARLATIELEVALDTLFRRLPDMQITNLDKLRWHQRNALRGVESLSAIW